MPGEGGHRLPRTAVAPFLSRARGSLPAQALAVALALLPAVHPVLRPVLGPPSHLLWFTHVFPIAWATYVWGLRGGVFTVTLSALSVFAGESVFGAGFWVPADAATRWALVLAVGLTEALVAAFALWIRSAEHERADLERLALAALDASFDAVMLLDNDGRVRNANRVALLLFADRDGAVIGRSLEDLLDDARAAPELTAATGGRWEGVARSGNGHPFPAEFRFSPVNDPSGSTTAWLVTIHDRTEELQHEEQDRRNQALSELGAVVAGVAHELNNPLTTVTTYAELLGDQRDALPADTEEAIQVMGHEARRAADIVRQLLQRVRRSSDKRIGLDLGHVVQTVIKARAPHFAAHSIRAVVKLDQDLPLVLGSAGEIEQILVNLVANAQYAMYKAHGAGELTVSARRRNGGVEVAVQDDGPGIPADILPRIFDPFFSTKGADGNGLGLAIARRIARAHGGDLRAENTAPAGARFVLQLPEASAGRDAHATPARPLQVVVPRRLAVLVVDDEAGIRGSLTRLLKRRGHHVTSAESVEQARFLLASRPFDAILADVHVGDESGLDLYRAVAATRPDLVRRWVFMTGDVFGSDVATFLRETQALHLSKPFEMSDLLNALERAAGDERALVAGAGPAA